MTSDHRDRPNFWKVTGPEGLVFDFDHDYDRRGDITRIGGYFIGIDGGLSDVTHDGLGRLTGARGPWGQASYRYDAMGNLTRRAIGSDVADFEYDDATLVRIDSDQRDDWDGPVQHDANGNVRAARGAMHWFDQMNRLVRSVEGSVTTTNAYDGDGIRVRTRVEETADRGSSWTRTTYTVYSADGKLLHELDGETGEERDYVYLADMPIATAGRHKDADSDGDGILDAIERLHGLDAFYAADAGQDMDGDGVSNRDEIFVGTWPSRIDTDRDGRPDNLGPQLHDEEPPIGAASEGDAGGADWPALMLILD